MSEMILFCFVHSFTLAQTSAEALLTSYKNGGEVKEFLLLAAHETRHDFRLLQWMHPLILCPGAAEWLITLSLACSPSFCLHPSPGSSLAASPFGPTRRWADLGCLCLQGLLESEVCSEKNCFMREDGQTVVSLHGGMYGAERQEGKHGEMPDLGTHSALSEARACTQHRCWKRSGEGVKPGWWRESRKKEHAHF